ncbi:MAG: hypothetical protein HQK50_09230, partial [Oligoflexia bacterium]|nr:hypothetical protein [Oligoflexia bacterium]
MIYFLLFILLTSVDLASIDASESISISMEEFSSGNTDHREILDSISEARFAMPFERTGYYADIVSSDRSHEFSPNSISLTPEMLRKIRLSRYGYWLEHINETYKDCVEVMYLDYAIEGSRGDEFMALRYLQSLPDYKYTSLVMDTIEYYQCQNPEMSFKLFIDARNILNESPIRVLFLFKKLPLLLKKENDKIAGVDYLSIEDMLIRSKRIIERGSKNTDDPIKKTTSIKYTNDFKDVF